MLHKHNLVGGGVIQGAVGGDGYCEACRPPEYVTRLVAACRAYSNFTSGENRYEIEAALQHFDDMCARDARGLVAEFEQDARGHR